MKAADRRNEEPDLAEDSLSLFDDGIEQQIPRQKPGLWLTATAIMTGFVIACAGGYWVYDTFLSTYGEKPMVYYEIKAIDDSGHPVAGADVALDKIKHGVTDSFGEWRKYVPSSRGASVRLELSKETGLGFIAATKNLVVPLRSPKKGDLSIVKTVALLPPRQIVREEPAVAQSQVEQPQQVAVQDEVSEKVVEEPETSASNDAFAFNTVHIRVKEKTFSPGNKLGKKRFDFLSGPTLHFLKKATIRAGVAIDAESPWVVELTHLSVGNGSSLIKVESSYDGQTNSYLRNYYKTPELTAAKILALLKLHAWKTYAVMHDDQKWFAVVPENTPKFWLPRIGNHLIGSEGTAYRVSTNEAEGNFQKFSLATEGGDPCVKNMSEDGRCTLVSANFQALRPNADWSAQTVKVVGSIPQDAKFYFSGFEGKQAGSSLQYWGKTGRGTNLTVVKNDRVVLRKRLINGKPDSSTISIPVSTVARR